MWPNVELVVRAHLATALNGRVVTVLPATLEDQLPVTRVTRGPGSDDGVTDSPLIDVETFAATRTAMWTLAEQTRQALHDLAGTSVDGVLFDSVRTASGPVWVDYENRKVQRAVASYRVTLRR
jgi:hypothetical protein